MRSSACCRQENAIFPPHIHQTWPEPFSRALYVLTPKMQNGDGADGKILTTLGGGSADSEEAKVHRCRGSTTSLSAGEATVAKSHASYGRDPYPANYLCRWLFLPVGGCQIGLQCREGNNSDALFHTAVIFM